MARIIEFIEGTGNVSSKISDVECVYTRGIVENEKYVTFSTFGSKSRKDGCSASQVLHINKKCAEQMVEILKREFKL